MRLSGFTVAFDLDGTLIDTAPDLVGALNGVLQEEGLPCLSLDSSRFLVGRGARVLIERGFAAAAAPLPEPRLDGLVDRFIEIYRARISLESRPFPGVETALDVLRDEGARLAVCTNKPTDLARQLLSELKLDGYFQAIVGGDAPPRPKPDASHMIKAVTDAGGRIERSVMVGDSETDVGAARASKAPVIVVPFGYTTTRPEDLGADWLAAHYDEIPAIVLDIALNRASPSAIGSAPG